MRRWPRSTRTSAWRLSARSPSRGSAAATSPPASRSCSASCSKISARSAARYCPWPATPSDPRARLRAWRGSRHRIGPEVPRSLIEEKLELQEAKRQSVTATDAEVNNGLQQIEKQNNMKSGQLNEFMKASGIDRGSLVDQLTAGIVWAKLVRRQAAQSTEISDEEIDEAVKRAKEHAGEPQSRVAEIFLAVDNPAQEGEVRAVAEKLTQQM